MGEKTTVPAVGVVDVSAVPVDALAAVMGRIDEWPVAELFAGGVLEVGVFAAWHPGDVVRFVRALRAAALVLACTHSAAAGDAVLDVADAIKAHAAGSCGTRGESS